MSTSYDDAILDALIATLKKINGSSAFRNTLITTGNQPPRVYKGFMHRPPTPPIAPATGVPGRPTIALYFAGQKNTAGPSMQGRTKEVVFLLSAWTAGSPRHPSQRMTNAANLGRDIDKALGSNLGLGHTSTNYPGYSARSFVDGMEWISDVGDTARDGQASQGAQWGFLGMEITVSYRETRPAQSPAA